jgi:hypothetical protein
VRPVVFVKYYDKGSTALGADLVGAALVARGVDARSIYHHELAGVRDATVVFIKRADLLHLLGARRRGCRTVLDVHDTVVFKRGIKFASLYDGLIFKNRRQLRDFGRRRAVSRVIYHLWDPRYRHHQAPAGELRVGYLGDRRSLAMWGQLPGVECVSDDFFQAAPRFNAHLSVREAGRDFLYKPGAKVSTAAACGAVLVTTADESAREMLGPDYPFYCPPDRQGILAAIERLRGAMEGPEWRRALARLAEVRERTAPDVIAGEYLEFLDAVERGERGAGTAVAR